MGRRADGESIQPRARSMDCAFGLHATGSYIPLWGIVAKEAREEHQLADPIGVIIRFRGDSDELLERFELVRRRWIDAQNSDYERPAFYAACRTEDGIAIVSGWKSAVAHRAFGQGLHEQINAVGMGEPAEIERLLIAELGWN